ncbi:LOG family protein [Bdellovibrio svalbardensis]|uniref:Cytokinin riboside 5'-monophosphate phosphoribohydrolase n=1 Tax=Bdellovibrio svalbardensis TaxID=2972972 RepID=A0ABT6DJ65_9BACT|nr:TIGR00730 family Rossman fold protein [Bdellovibrio svalbardensis]MDG0816882.1 TIGR00730 family Rossman fold protein [Bdellovibrio svalbardensis]
MSIKRVCVYCGASLGNNPNFAKAAKELGHLLAKENIELVYGGGKVGLMGVLADAVLEKGGKVIGIIPQKLVDKEQAHRGLQDLRIVNDMHERKATMAALADAFIALPGGFGTMEELFEVLTWSQIGYHQKPVAVLEVDNYYEHLNNFINHAKTTGLLKPEFAQFFQLTHSVQDAWKALQGV